MQYCGNKKHQNYTVSLWYMMMTRDERLQSWYVHLKDTFTSFTLIILLSFLLKQFAFFMKKLIRFPLKWLNSLGQETVVDLRFGKVVRLDFIQGAGILVTCNAKLKSASQGTSESLRTGIDSSACLHLFFLVLLHLYPFLFIEELCLV